MRKALLFSMTVLLAALLAACGGGKTAEPTPAPTTAPTAAPSPAPAQGGLQGDAEQGKQIFVSSCAACHGPEGQGVQGLGKDMQHSEFVAELSDEELLAFIKQGRPISDPLNTTGIDMPPKGGNPALTDAQLGNIIAYIRSIHQ